MDNFKEKTMRIAVPFLLLLLVFLSGCTMELPRQPGLGPGLSYYFITESFDFVSSDFNWATFNAQRSAWQERAYKNYSYVLSVSGRNTSEDPEDLWEEYECEVIVEEGKDPELTWIEGVPPEDGPSVYTIDGVFDFISAAVEDPSSFG
jgi:hypothetical protein